MYSALWGMVSAVDAQTLRVLYRKNGVFTAPVPPFPRIGPGTPRSRYERFHFVVVFLFAFLGGRLCLLVRFANV